MGLSVSLRKMLLKITGAMRPDVYSAYMKLKRSCGFTSEEVRGEAMGKLRDLLGYAYDFVPYYRKMFDQAGFDPKDFSIDDFRKLPVLTKDIIRENHDALISTEDLKKIMMKTGGSTGEPLRVFKDFECRAQDIASQYIGMEFSGFRFLEDRFAFFIGGSLGMDKENSFSRRLGDYIFKRVTLPAFDLNNDTVERYHDIIVKKKCRYIFAYASILYNLASCMDRKGLSFGEGDLKGVFTTSETLYPERRELIEKILKCRIYDFYGSVEVNCIATQCRNQNYHILANCVHLETDDDDNLIITDLKNYAQPIIRYRNADKVVMADAGEKCGCGLPFPVLKTVLGRTGDIIYRKNGEPVSNAYFPHLFARLKSFESFQVVQPDYGLINLNLVMSPAFDAAEEKTLILKLKEYLGNDMEITINYVDRIPLTKSGKLRITISEIQDAGNVL